MGDQGEHGVDIDAVLDRLPVLAGIDRTVSRLPGGLTNVNVRVRTATGLDLVVRISPPSTALLAVDRHEEWVNTRRAAAAGVGAPVIDYLPGQGVLVVGFLPGVTYTAPDVARNLSGVADAVARLHRGEPFESRFDMFTLRERYLDLVHRRGFRLPDGYEDLADAVARLRAVLAAHPEPLVPCHNDLLAANFLDHQGVVSIIDYEYSGNNEASFELGNLWAESQLAPEHLEELVGEYQLRRGHLDPAMVARAELWGHFARHGWTLWGVIQAHISGLDEDFWGWALEKHEPAMAFFTSGRFGRLIEVVGRGAQ